MATAPAKVMRAWLYSSTTGGLHKSLTLSATAAHPRPQSPPSLSKDELLVRVRAAGLNPIDYKIAELPYGMSRAVVSVPASPAMDFAGTVVAHGAAVEFPVKVGDSAFGRLDPGRFGALGKFVVAKSSGCASLPGGVSLEHASGVGSVGLAALASIVPHVPGNLPPSSAGGGGAPFRVFINGGSGGTGTFGIQIAKLLGCHVTASCSARNVELCRSLGADEVLDYTQGLVDALKAKGQVFGLVVDNVGSSPRDLYSACGEFLLPNGQFVQVGAGMSMADMRLMTSRMLLPSFLGGGTRKFSLAMAKNKHEDLARLGEWIATGKIKVVVDEVFEFGNAPKAYEKLRTGRARGKIIVKGAP
ncbi:putative zinc alcohol [Diaporthe ampelina]|uniref:Putative zinc alcohol n=1 Tax=Diaporthe ampelina TaxID=1214573 RepID=A0A0G2FIQ7_9PEZI|nr:putative zinc alcohol [Diaporthe ampelina]